MNAVDELGQAPITVRLDVGQYLRIDRVDVCCLDVAVCEWLARDMHCGYWLRTNELREEHGDERRDEVVDALHVTTRGVSNGPNVQHAVQHLLNVRVLKDGHIGVRARYVRANLSTTR